MSILNKHIIKGEIIAFVSFALLRIIVEYSDLINRQILILSAFILTGIAIIGFSLMALGMYRIIKTRSDDIVNAMASFFIFAVLFSLMMSI